MNDIITLFSFFKIKHVQNVPLHDIITVHEAGEGNCHGCLFQLGDRDMCNFGDKERNILEKHFGFPTGYGCGANHSIFVRKSKWNKQ